MTTPGNPRDLLGPLDVPPLTRDLTSRVLAAAAPLLATNASHASTRAWLRPLVVALLPLPLVVAADVTIVRTLYTILSAMLPAVLSLYLVVQYALVLVLLVGLAYAAVPILAERQARAVLETVHV